MATLVVHNQTSSAQDAEALQQAFKGLHKFTQF